MSKNLQSRERAGRLAALAVVASLACALPGSALAASPVQASPAGGRTASSSAAAAEPVYTRARPMSVAPHAHGHLLVRLKLLPRAKIPFTTQTFKATDPSLLADIPEGAWVKFTALHVDGENVLTSIHVVEECRRFQACD